MNTYKGYDLVRASKSFFSNYNNFIGRSTASAYWMWTLTNMIVTSILSAVDGMIDAQIFGSIWSLVVLIPGLALTCRRLHDSGRSGWNFLWAFLPLIGWIYLIVLMCKDSQAGTNKWGASEKYPEESV